MARTRLLAIGVAAAALAVLLTVLARPASADRPFDERSLNGTYVGGLVEIRQETALDPVEYCDESGTLTFDGHGNGSSNITRRCSLEGTVTDPLTLTYTVNASGGVHIFFSSGEEGTAQLAEGGQIGFVSAVGDADARIFVRHGAFANLR
jgi:hypothetical protein